MISHVFICAVCGKEVTQKFNDNEELEEELLYTPYICEPCFKCPKCNTVCHSKEAEKLRCDGPIIEDGYVNCDVCGSGYSYKSFAKKVINKANLVKCPHCNGKGFVLDQK